MFALRQLNCLRVASQLRATTSCYSTSSYNQPEVFEMSEETKAPVTTTSTTTHSRPFTFNHFKIAELVDLLERENARDIFVCTVPKEHKYVDYMVICTGHNFRSMLALSNIVRHQYKQMNTRHINMLPKIEGEKSKDWMALDLGNIALNIFSRNARPIYDLELLWSVGNPKEPVAVS